GRAKPTRTSRATTPATVRIGPTREIAPSAAIDRIVKPRRSATSRNPTPSVLDIAVDHAGFDRMTPAADRSGFAASVATLDRTPKERVLPRVGRFFACASRARGIPAGIAWTTPGRGEGTRVAEAGGATARPEERREGT